MTDIYKNLFIVSGFVAKPLSIREISNGRHTLILVLKTKNIHGEECFLRLVSYTKSVIDQAVGLGLSEGYPVLVTGHNDVLKWKDVKSNTTKSRQTMIIDEVEILNLRGSKENDE